VFFTLESSTEVVQEALNLGAGYVAKMRARTDLPVALTEVLQGKHFISGDFLTTDRG